MNNINSSLLIQERRNSFGAFGVPRNNVSDNGSATSGQAEITVCETRQALSKDHNGGTPRRLAKFLSNQNAMIGLSTGKQSAMLMFGIEISTALAGLR